MLARLVGDVEAFLDEAWEQRPLLRRDVDDAGFADLLSLDDVDRLVTTTSPRPPAFRMVRDGDVLPRSSYTRRGTVGGRRLSDLPDVGRVLASFEAGATLVLQGLHRWHEPVARLKEGLEAELTHPVQVNAYLTPPGAAGLDVHHDTHDVLVLQTHGAKHWRIHEPAVEVPLPEQRWSGDEHEPAAVVIDDDLTPGDLLYLPRGTPHVAETAASVSLHVTIGIRAIRWRDVLVRVVTDIGAERAFRDGLPPGFAHAPGNLRDGLADRLELLAERLRARDPVDLAHDEAERFWGERPPTLRGQLHEVMGLADITDDTRVQRRRHTSAFLRPDDDGSRITLVLGDRTVSLPGHARPALERALAAEALRPRDLDDLLDRDGRLVLIRRLVREGLFSTAAEADRG